MGLFDAGRDMLSEVHAAHGELVTLVIDGVETLNVRATPAGCKLKHDQLQQSGQVPSYLLVDMQDWLIETDDYATLIDGDLVAVVPKSGDRIISDGTPFEVLPIGEVEDCYYTRDTGGTKLRVHSKRVSGSE